MTRDTVHEIRDTNNGIRNTDRAVKDMHGVLNVYKPCGITSFGVVSYIRKMLDISKVGHTGTLDPNAEGVLLVCLGKATKIVQFLIDRDKEYEAEMILGLETDTGDTTGRIVRTEDSVSVTEEKLQKAFELFRGEIEQVPPMFSAVKYKGKRLYELARKGIEVQRSRRVVKIFNLEILAYDSAAVKLHKKVKFRVCCSKGTYIRTLCEDIGNALGCGACLDTLVRKRVGNFYIDDSLTLKQLSEMFADRTLSDYVLSLNYALGHLPVVMVNDSIAERSINGNPIHGYEIASHSSGLNEGDIVRVNNVEHGLIALAKTESVNPVFFKMLRVLKN